MPREAAEGVELGGTELAGSESMTQRLPTAKPSGLTRGAPVHVAGVVPGAWEDGRITVDRATASGQLSFLRVVMAHEWAHLAAYARGSGAFFGAPPAGWPAGYPRAEEQWADCVAEVLTGLVLPSHGLGPCPGPARSFTRAWLATGP